VLWPKVAVSGGLDLKSSYVALRNYLRGNQKGKGIEQNGRSFNDIDLSTENSMPIQQMTAKSFQKDSASYIAALQDTLHGWRFIVTRKGYVGVIPKMAQVGNLVAIMKGGRVPFILQRSEEREGAFRLVGECYVHCLMNVEGLSLPRVAEGEFRLY